MNKNIRAQEAAKAQAKREHPSFYKAASKYAEDGSKHEFDTSEYIHIEGHKDTSYRRGFLSGVEKAIELIQCTEEQEQGRLRNILIEELMELRPEE